jgi:tetratricopeptide (TPR) repeat protein
LRVLEHDPPLASSGRPEVPRELAHIAEKALEKDPRRRYPDANALQRELSRYLEAGAVSARGIGRVGRILRLVERRPLPWAIGSCLGLIAVVFLAIAVRNQLVSERQARAAERFARRSAEIESEVRFEELLPLHSIAAQRPRLLAARERLASDVKKSDGRARAAGEYAVGRVDLALDEAQSAEQRLTRARALGFDDPEGALTLAEAMIEQGRSDLRAVDLVHDSEVRAAERERLRDQLRAEVLPLLNEATRAAGFGRESQLMALALVAQLEDRAQEADDLAREVIELSPWMYEADLVRADVLRQSASLSRSNGEIEAAKALQGRERDLLENALERAPSALSLRERLCESWMLTAQTDLDATSSKDTWETSFAAAERACEKALVILPDALGPRALVVEIGWRRALQRLRRLGAEAVAEDVEVLVAQAEALQQLAPEGYRENWNLGNALYAWARFERERGESPVATLERSARALQRGLEHAPGLAFGWQSLGITWTEHGNALEARGENPIPSYERALQAFAEGRGGSKAQLSRLENALCNAQLGIAYYISQHPGAAPRERVDRALSQASEACERALAVLPGYLSALSNLALTHWTEVEWRITQDESPEAAARAATRSFDELLSLAPEHVSGRINRAGMTAAFMQWQLDSQDGAPIATDDRLRQVIREVRAARTSVAPLAANFPGDVHTHLARLATLEAAAVCTLDPTAEEIEELWAGAERATRRLAEASAIPREVLLRQAQYHRRSAECRARTTSGASSSQGPAVAALREGISAIEQSLKVDPDFVEAKREQAILLRLLARARETHAPADA